MGKARRSVKQSYSTIHTTSTDSRPGFFLQTQPSSSDGIIGLFKADPQKKVDKELSNKVRLHEARNTEALLIDPDKYDQAAIA